MLWAAEWLRAHVQSTSVRGMACPIPKVGQFEFELTLSPPSHPCFSDCSTPEQAARLSAVITLLASRSALEQPVNIHEKSSSQLAGQWEMWPECVVQPLLLVRTSFHGSRFPFNPVSHLQDSPEATAWAVLLAEGPVGYFGNKKEEQHRALIS